MFISCWRVFALLPHFTYMPLCQGQNRYGGKVRKTIKGTYYFAMAWSEIVSGACVSWVWKIWDEGERWSITLPVTTCLALTFFPVLQVVVTHIKCFGSLKVSIFCLVMYQIICTCKDVFSAARPGRALTKASQQVEYLLYLCFLLWPGVLGIQKWSASF